MMTAYWTKASLPSPLVDAIRQLARSGNAATYGQYDGELADRLAEAAKIVGAASADDVHRLYGIYLHWCVEYPWPTDGATESLAPCQRFYRPHYESNGWYTRKLTAAEIAAVYRGECA